MAGWKSKSLAWFVGLISANLPLSGYDGPAHLGSSANSMLASVVPWAMVSTVIVNWAIAMAFSYWILPRFENAISRPTGYDFIEVFYTAVGPAGAAKMTAVLIMLVWTWAFARDPWTAIFYWNFFAYVNKTLALPLRAIPGLLALINIGSTVAFNALVSISKAGIFTSYP
ncbi:hypothetical protein AC578_4622 [Pseudocercospora eumusae]|uniref:Uncharacterized protein n=1 Tax=Pseudocercospora eumusae TaxID=321146 RepID=A0A139GZC2_9PEZI|nr:hypothetical protein AC578_4622 [Pseudocercospora eumusae]